jgi:hypothetical protein
MVNILLICFLFKNYLEKGKINCQCFELRFRKTYKNSKKIKRLEAACNKLTYDLW